MSEAVYRCQHCQHLYHVRCMGHYAAVGSRTCTYKVTRFLCKMDLESQTRTTHPPCIERQQKEVPASLSFGVGGSAGGVQHATPDYAPKGLTKSALDAQMCFSHPPFP